MTIPIKSQLTQTRTVMKKEDKTPWPVQIRIGIEKLESTEEGRKIIKSWKRALNQ